MYSLDPEASLLSTRGKVLEHGVSPQFFRILAKGLFDIKDLKFRSNELADFVGRGFNSLWVLCKKGYGIWLFKWRQYCSKHFPAPASYLPSGVLFRLMVPLIPETLPDLARKHIFMSFGIYDPIVSKQEAERLFNSFKTGGTITISHSVGKRLVMSEQWRRCRNQKSGRISEPYFFECVPVK